MKRAWLDEAVARMRSDKGKSRRLPAEAISVNLDLTGIATAFVGPTFTLAELRALYEGVWGVHLDDAPPGATGGKPAELFRAGGMWKLGGPIRRSQPNERRKADS